MVAQSDRSARQDIYTLNLPWEQPPLSLLDDQQQLDLRQQAQVSHHITGEILWSSRAPGSQLLIVASQR
jgi:hypothetical protein